MGMIDPTNIAYSNANSYMEISLNKFIKAVEDAKAVYAEQVEKCIEQNKGLTDDEKRQLKDEWVLPL